MPPRGAAKGERRRCRRSRNSRPVRSDPPLRVRASRRNERLRRRPPPLPTSNTSSSSSTTTRPSPPRWSRAPRPCSTPSVPRGGPCETPRRPQPSDPTERRRSPRLLLLRIARPRRGQRGPNCGGWALRGSAKRKARQLAAHERHVLFGGRDEHPSVSGRTRSWVSAIRASRKEGRNRLGRASVESGQSRVPAPPAGGGIMAEPVRPILNSNLSPSISTSGTRLTPNRSLTAAASTASEPSRRLPGRHRDSRLRWQAFPRSRHRLPSDP